MTMPQRDNKTNSKIILNIFSPIDASTGAFNVSITIIDPTTALVLDQFETSVTVTPTMLLSTSDWKQGILTTVNTFLKANGYTGLTLANVLNT